MANEYKKPPMGVEHFVRKLKRLAGPDYDYDSRFIFFLGAGCSVSSGIPAAGALVKDWLRRLKEEERGDDGDLGPWIKNKFPEYTESNSASYYKEVMEELFITAIERQKEIERIVDGKDPGFGYGALARLMSHNDYGRHFNTILTTNFDDMVADALYLYSKKKPLVISEESLVGFIRITSTLPLVLKVHGDVRLAPKNTTLEVQDLNKALKEVLHKLLLETGIIFVGYGGNDEGIAKMLLELPPTALPRGIYWVNKEFPDGKMGEWLRNRNATWVNHLDFDELMLLIHREFKLGHPDKDRYEKVYNTYINTFEKLYKKIETKPADEKKMFEPAYTEAANEFKNWYTVENEAAKYKTTDKEKANEIYKEGLKKFPNSVSLIGYYAIFLDEQCKNYDEAEKLYKQAITLDPINANSLRNYALFLEFSRKNYDDVEKYYKQAIEVAPNDSGILVNYANFLAYSRKNYDDAEKLYKQAIEIDPNNTDYLRNYAFFLISHRKNYDEAEKFYKQAIEINPNNSDILTHYAFLLAEIRKNHDEAEKYYKQAIEIDPNNADILARYADFLAYYFNNYDEAEKYYKQAIEIDPNNLETLRGYGAALLVCGKYDDGFSYLQKAIKLAGDNDTKVLMRYLFYQYVYLKNGYTIDSLLQIKKLIKDGIRTPKWKPKRHLDSAIADGFPNPEFLTTLAAVIVDKEKAEALDKFEAWTSIE
ncbi:MAG: tetratricopeptide repeat protein [Nitrospirae bacterium]|nr:tetratricopeptide repeat protein [Nitrospirota bacterium]